MASGHMEKLPKLLAKQEHVTQQAERRSSVEASEYPRATVSHPANEHPGRLSTLVLSRRVSQSFVIFPDAMLDPSTPVSELFRGGPIKITVTQVNGARVKLGIR